MHLVWDIERSPGGNTPRSVSALRFRLSTKAYHPFHSPFVVAFPIRFPSLFDDENSVLESRMPVFAKLKIRIEAASAEMEVGEIRQQGIFSEIVEQQAAR